MGSRIPTSSFYLLFTTHHLVSQKKHSHLRSLSRHCNLQGFIKRGYPGVVLLTAGSYHDPAGGAGYFEEEDAQRDALARMSSTITQMQWASKAIRPIQPLSPSAFQSLRLALLEFDSLPDGATKPPPSHLDLRNLNRVERSPLVNLETMKQISTLFARADQIHLLLQARKGSPHPTSNSSSKVSSKNGGEVDLSTDQETWADLWTRENLDASTVPSRESA